MRLKFLKIHDMNILSCWVFCFVSGVFSRTVSTAWICEYVHRRRIQRPSSGTLSMPFSPLARGMGG